MAIVETGTLHFRIEPEGIVDLVRQAYWMEDRKEWALETLGCMSGITEEQKMSVLKGDATLITEDGGKTVTLIYQEDKGWKGTLDEYQKWKESTYMVFAGRQVPKELVDNYAGHIVKRLRNIMRGGVVSVLAVQSPESVLELERMRVKLHRDILICAGFTYDWDTNEYKEKDTEDFRAFNRELSDYLDKVAGKFV